MRSKLLTIAAFLALSTTLPAVAQQASGQDDQSASTPPRQTSVSWSHSDAQPEQPADLYQGKPHDNGGFGDTSTGNGQTLPGALDSGLDPLGSGRQPDQKE